MNDELNSSNLRIPPQNLEAEQGLLGSLLIDKDAIIKVADIIKPNDFYKQSHSLIFEAMEELYAKHEPTDILSISNRLEEKKQIESVGGRSYLIELSNITPTSSHALSYANIIHKKATLRRLLGTANVIGELVYKEDEDLSVILDKAEKELFGVSQKYSKQAFVPIKNVLEGAFERIDELHRERGKLRGIPTGFMGLDNYLSGLQNSDLVILAARPSVGKTSFALDLARSAAKQKNAVGIFSLEMSKEQLVDRLICSEANIDLWKMRTGKLTESSDDFTRIGNALGTLSEIPLYIDDAASCNIMDIRTKARRLQMDRGLDMLIIDYLQLLESRSSRSSSDNRVQEVAEITRGLKAIARELNIPVLALSQLSRAVEASKPAIPKLSHLRESGCLSGDTLIFDTKTGIQTPIKELVENNKKINSLTINKNYKNESIKINKLFNNGKKQVFELTTRTGRIIKASANHKFLKLGRWVPLAELKGGDKIAVPRILPEPQLTKIIPDYKLLVLAHLIGDGCYLKKQPLHYTNNDPLAISAVENAGKKFGVMPKIVPQKTWWHIYLTGKNYSGEKNPIIEWLKELKIYNQRSKEKIIPNIVFSLSNKQLAFFIKHLWSTDGCISFSKKSGGWVLFYASNNRKLISQLQTLLLRFEIISTVRINRKKGYAPVFGLHIQGAGEQLKFLNQIGIFGRKAILVEQAKKELRAKKINVNLDTIPKEIWQYISEIKISYGLSWRKFAKKLEMSYCGSTLFKHGISRERMYRIIKFLPDEKLVDLADSNIYWDEIISIKPLGIETVYDLNIPKNHNFTANGIFAHNSIEQDADVVMFIYRKSADRNYSINDLDPQERSIAEIFIAKHRNGPTGEVKLFFDEQRVSFRDLEKRLEAPQMSAPSAPSAPQQEKKPAPPAEDPPF